MLRLDRRDDPGVHFIEMITLAGDGQSRARTWQWFRDGCRSSERFATRCG
jgi:hypothetical protein